MLLLVPQLDVHAVGFGGSGHSEHRGVVWLPSILGPGKLEPPEQGDDDQEELHASQAFPQTHPGTCTSTGLYRLMLIIVHTLESLKHLVIVLIRLII